MGSIVLKSLSVLLGIFFVFVGTMKLTSHISKDLHKDLNSRRMYFSTFVRRQDGVASALKCLSLRAF
ncbi:transmembrane protein 35A [Vespula maculifrons]|uniref:Transmembrane protein 35A n=1 Tax=Vespula maculifrons TaxID=7453 RepID=A0ABD2BWD9_VESMC